MWQSPSQRSRAIASAKRRARERNRIPIHFRRMSGSLEIVPSDGLEVDPALKGSFEIRVVINDLNSKGVSIFSPKPIPARQSILLTLNDPYKITIKGRVIYNQEHNPNSHVLSQVHFTNRVGIEFVTLDDAEKQTIIRYVEETLSNFLLAAI